MVYLCSYKPGVKTPGYDGSRFTYKDALFFLLPSPTPLLQPPPTDGLETPGYSGAGKTYPKTSASLLLRVLPLPSKLITSSPHEVST